MDGMEWAFMTLHQLHSHSKHNNREQTRANRMAPTR